MKIWSLCASELQRLTALDLGVGETRPGHLGPSWGHAGPWELALAPQAHSRPPPQWRAAAMAGATGCEFADS